MIDGTGERRSFEEDEAKLIQMWLDDPDPRDTEHRLDSVIADNIQWQRPDWASILTAEKLRLQVISKHIPDSLLVKSAINEMEVKIFRNCSHVMAGLRLEFSVMASNRTAYGNPLVMLILKHGLSRMELRVSETQYLEENFNGK